MGPIDQVRMIITPSLDAMGYEVVRVQMSGKERPQLQIMAERVDRRGMTVDDCARISRAVSAVLDVEDPIAGPYTLEVSSPGIDRPLTRAEDWRRFRGHEAKVDLRVALDGRKRFRGLLDGAEGETAFLLAEGGDRVALPLADIQRAKLVLTDALIAAAEAEARDAAARQAAAANGSAPQTENGQSPDGAAGREQNTAS